MHELDALPSLVRQWGPQLAIAAAAITLAVWPVAAQTTSAATIQPSPAAQPGIAAVAIPVARMNTDILGFRSARFGASEAEVRGAMIKDLKVKAASIVAVESSTEKTPSPDDESSRCHSNSGQRNG